MIQLSLPTKLPFVFVVSPKPRNRTTRVSCSSFASYHNGFPNNNKRVFLLDVNPLCYSGTRPSLECFAKWVSLLLSEVSLTDPVIAVLDGQHGPHLRTQLLPSYKASRWSNFSHEGFVGRSHNLIADILAKCSIPLLRLPGHEADDVIATLANQALNLKGFTVVIASPDKDFKQLLSDHLQMVMPLTDLNRWSFYTLKHYASHYNNCDPRSDLSLRCILGDEVDGVPGIQHVAPGFGRKTALKLLKKHGSLDNLLAAAAVRSVAKQYAQDALVNHADYLRRNYQVLALRTDVDVELRDEWLTQRHATNDTAVLGGFFKMLEERNKVFRRSGL